MVWFSPQPVNGSNGLPGAVRVSAQVPIRSWPQKLVDGGLWKPATFCVPLPWTAQGLNHHSCAREWNKHGGCGGGPSCRAQLFEL